MAENIPQLVTLLAVAKALCVSPHTIRAWVADLEAGQEEARRVAESLKQCFWRLPE